MELEVTALVTEDGDPKTDLPLTYRKQSGCRAGLDGDGSEVL